MDEKMQIANKLMHKKALRTQTKVFMTMIFDSLEHFIGSSPFLSYYGIRMGDLSLDS